MSRQSSPQEAPSFRDLEPEGYPIEQHNTTENAAGDVPTFEVSPLDTLGEYEFRNPEMFDQFENLDELNEDSEDFDELNSPTRRPELRSALAISAGRTALKWSGYPISGLSTRQSPASRSRLDHALSDFYETPYLGDQLEQADESLELETCSAALREAYELMDQLAATAAKGRSSPEAERLIAAIVPLAISLTPNFYRILWPALPVLIQGMVGVTRLLFSRSSTRALLRRIPVILRGTVIQLTHLLEQGQSFNQRSVAKILAKQTAITLSRSSTGTTSTPPQRLRRSRSKFYDAY